MLFSKLSFYTKVFLIIQAIGMLMGTSTHVAWAIQHGFLSENYHAPLFSKIFWDSLTFLDPLAAMLLIFAPKRGTWLTLVIILADILHNNLFYMNELYINPPSIADWFKKYWMIAGQIAFGIFVASTFKFNLNEIKKASVKQ